MEDQEKIDIIHRGLQRILDNTNVDISELKEDGTEALAVLVDISSKVAAIRTEASRLIEDCGLDTLPTTHVRENDIKPCKSDPCECGAGTCASHGTHNCSICEKNGSGHWEKCPCDRCERIRYEKGEASVKAVVKVDLHISGGKCTCFRCREAKEGKKLPPIAEVDDCTCGCKRLRHDAYAKCIDCSCKSYRSSRFHPEVSDIHEECDGKTCVCDVVEHCPKWENAG